MFRKYEFIDGVIKNDSKADRKYKDLMVLCQKATYKYPPEYFAEWIISKSYKKGKPFFKISFFWMGIEKMCSFVYNNKSINKLLEYEKLKVEPKKSSNSLFGEYYSHILVYPPPSEVSLLLSND